MASYLAAHNVQQFATNIQLLLQQKGSKLRSVVMSGSHYGAQASPVDQIGAVSATAVTTQFGAMPRTDATLSRRWVAPSSFDLNQLVDSFEKLQLLNDPTSSLVQNAVYALGRKMDETIINAFFDAATTGTTGTGSTTFAAGGGVTVAAGATGLTVAKLRAAKKALMAAQVDLDNDPIFAVITATQHDNLLAEASIISTDFNSKPVLVDGKVTQFMGINFIHSELVELETGERAVPIFAKSGMYLGVWGDIQTDISERKDLQSIPWQAYCKGTFGATRLEEKKIVKVLCAE